MQFRHKNFLLKESTYLQKPRDIPLLIKIVYTQTFDQQMYLYHAFLIKNTLNETWKMLISLFNLFNIYNIYHISSRKKI